MKHSFERYCKDFENIENYQKAKAENFKGWHCHHRLETHTPDGKRRDADISHKKLKALGMYYNRPASELIFLPRSEHEAYRKGKSRSEESRRKMREAKKGEKHPMYGKHLSEETRKKIGEANKGNKNNLGTRWFNNGKINKRAKECPPGFIPGMLK